ncbi:NFACT RNA binding domain-containing protein [Rufibacter quisquiliarum]|uniref:Putative ribosome quality control (RQC) complex YloA/Tae2 family protein n=1 Tax=Rufibacter quisquiliarum TaxID=1549639 RepID=A0A839GZ71_9BACT|nr:putative ribosome quality control (RQC) complex YloA/Tae2 family protein [Rufibacter quisquiliarum]
MHQNYYFLRQLAQKLEQTLKGFSLHSVFSQEKDELVLAFHNGAQEFFIKAIQTSTFSSLQFPATFNRARQNSVDLFTSVWGEQVLEVQAHRQERSFFIQFTQGKVLLFKLFGNRSNVILFEQDQPMALFHRKFAKDLELDYRAMHQNWHLTQEQFLAQPQLLGKMLPTLGDLPLLYLQEMGIEAKQPLAQWQLVQEMLAQLETPSYYLTYLDKVLRFSLLPVGQIQQKYTDPLEALNAFVPQYRAQEYFSRHYGAAHKSLQRQLEVAQKIWWQIQEQLETWHHGTPYAQTADVIMANLTNIPKGSAEVELYDFYQDTTRKIKLHATETPQKTAERLYKKAKNQQIELTLLQARAEKKEQEVERLGRQLKELEEITSAPQLRQYLKKNTVVPLPAGQELPFHTFETNGFKILVGKNAKANDKLTLHHTHKDDLWLHAKDVPGSHVVIKLKAGQPFPMPVIETAAQVAAYYSKRKNDTLCPVLYTPRKYVRKPRGATPGSVIVEREKVILVTPQNPFKVIP